MRDDVWRKQMDEISDEEFWRDFDLDTLYNPLFFDKEYIRCRLLRIERFKKLKKIINDE